LADTQEQVIFFSFAEDRRRQIETRSQAKCVSPLAMLPSRGGGGELGHAAAPDEAATASAASKREGEETPSAASPSTSSSSSTITARRPLGSRPLTLTPPPPVATLLRALASAGAILVDDDLRSRAAHALRAGEIPLFFPTRSLRGRRVVFFFLLLCPPLSFSQASSLFENLPFKASEPPLPRPPGGPERPCSGPSRTRPRPGSRGASPRKGRPRSTCR
jgi:hypothetical protein